MMTQISLRTIGAAVVIAIAVFMGGATSVQADLPIPAGVAAKTAPGDGAEGIGLGGFRAYPRVDLGLAYDDNIYRADDSLAGGVTSDSLIQLGPAVGIRSGWSRHSLNVGLFLSSDLYMDETDEDSTDWGIGASGQVDLMDSTNLTGGINYQDLTEPRGGINSPVNISEPSEYDQFDMNFALNHRFNQLTASVGAEYTDVEYDLTGQQYRDRSTWRGMGELGFEFSPGYSAFGRVIINDRDYDNAQALGSQDSDGYTFAAGISSELGNLISGDAWLGYMDQDYDDSSFQDVDGFSFGANLSWEPTTLTTVRVSAYRLIQDSATLGIGGIMTTGGGVGVDHELSRDLDLTADLDISNGDYEGSTRDDDTVSVSIGLDYQMTRKLDCSIKYAYDDRDSNIAGQDYTDNTVTFGVRFQH